MKNTMKKSIFIFGLIAIFIACVLIGNRLIETTNNSSGFKSQSIEVSKTTQDKTEVKADSKTNEQSSSSSSSENKSTLNQQNSQTDEAKTQKSLEQLSQDKNNKCTISIQTHGQVILAPETIEIKDGDTVYDVLKKVTREKSIQMEVSGTASNIYVKGIDNLYEFDKGPQSGWIYTVNKEFATKSCSAYKLSGGEVIEWHYTLNLGEDIKNQ